MTETKRANNTPVQLKRMRQARAALAAKRAAAKKVANHKNAATR